MIRSGAQRFRAHHLAFGHGMRNARAEATCLALHALNLRPDHLASRMGEPLTAAQIERVTTLFARRIQERKPAAYLTGKAWLGGFAFQIDERAVVPRSYIAELLHEDFTPWIARPNAVRTALDLCTGSGCLAVLLARSFPRSRIDATDISPAALALALTNVRTQRLGNRVRLIHSDLFSALHGKRYDLIVSNPPYVSTAVMRRLPREYRWEPALALTGGRDGLDLVRRIIDTARRHLNAGGLLVVEAGHSRKRVERSYPRIAFIWPETSGGMDCVFVVGRDQLPEG